MQRNEMIKPFIHLFLVDMVHCIEGNGYERYQKNEPGYDSCLLEAYITMFKDANDGIISKDRLKRCHEIAMRHLQKATGGQFKKQENNYEVRIPSTLSDSGFKQFISRWIISPKTVVHSLNITKHDRSHACALGLKDGSLQYIELKGKTASFRRYNPETDIETMLKLMRDNSYTVTFDASPNTPDWPTITADINYHMDEIINSYNAAISVAKSNDEIIAAIAKHVQEISQLHPFMDGNVRLCYMLLNKLLNDFGLPLTILINPNRLDGYSVAELIETIKDGQNIFQQMIRNQEDRLVISTNDILLPFKKFSLPSKVLNKVSPAIIDQFLLQVIERNIHKNTPVMAQTRFGIFAPTEQTPAKQIIAEMKTLVDQGKMPEQIYNFIAKSQYEVALRNACSQNIFAAIEFILRHKDTLQININSTSSNGNTALDWLDGCKINPDTIIHTRELLIKHGAKNKQEIKPQPS